MSAVDVDGNVVDGVFIVVEVVDVGRGDEVLVVDGVDGLDVEALVVVVVDRVDDGVDVVDEGMVDNVVVLRSVGDVVDDGLDVLDAVNIEMHVFHISSIILISVHKKLTYGSYSIMGLSIIIA